MKSEGESEKWKDKSEKWNVKVKTESEKLKWKVKVKSESKSNSISSHPIASNPIQSHPIPFHPIPSHPSMKSITEYDFLQIYSMIQIKQKTLFDIFYNDIEFENILFYPGLPLRCYLPRLDHI